MATRLKRATTQKTQAYTRNYNAALLIAQRTNTEQYMRMDLKLNEKQTPQKPV